MFYTDAVFAMPETNLRESGERKRLKGTNTKRNQGWTKEKMGAWKDTSNEQLNKLTEREEKEREGEKKRWRKSRRHLSHAFKMFR